MVTNEAIQGAMQEALTALLALSARYHLYYKDINRFGLSIAEDLHKLGEQAESHANEITKRLFLYNGEPEYAVELIEPAEKIDDMLNEMLAAELALDLKCFQWIKVCWEQGDGTMFHWFQHLSKWHVTGGNEYAIGPVSWLKKQLWQIKTVGLNAYIASQVTK
jgi:bacterioferritin (cytochrome b1)